jgi:hypothetical protein
VYITNNIVKENFGVALTELTEMYIRLSHKKANLVLQSVTAINIFIF